MASSSVTCITDALTRSSTVVPGRGRVHFHNELLVNLILCLTMHCDLYDHFRLLQS